jgi:hypothetical protein
MGLKSAHGRIFGLVIGFAAATAATAAAQDTSAVKNPPGYSGMERDTTLVPPSATTDSLADSLSDSVRVGTDSAAKHGKQHRDSTKVGETTPKRPEDSTERMHPDSAGKPE